MVFGINFISAVSHIYVKAKKGKDPYYRCFPVQKTRCISEVYET